MFLKEQKIFYKMVYYTLYLRFKPIVMNRVGKLEFTMKKRLGAWHFGLKKVFNQSIKIVHLKGVI